MFRNPYLSFSRLQKFEECPLRFKRQYIDGIREPASEPMRMGSLIHEVLETIVKRGQVNAATVSDIYPDLWAESGLRSESSYGEALDVIHGWVERWRDPDVMGTEEGIVILLDGRSESEGGRVVKCFIDRIDRLDSESVEVTDYKSSRVIPAREEVEDSLQLAIYSLAVRSKYRWVNNVKVTMDFVRYGRKVSAWRTLDQDLKTLAYLRMIGPVTESSDYEPCINGHCGSCSHRHDCPAYASVLASIPEIEAIPEEMARAKALRKIGTKRSEEIATVIKAELEAGDFEAGGMRFGLAETIHKSRPITATIDVLAAWSDLSRTEIAERITTISSGKLKALLKTLPPGAREAVDEVAEVYVGRRVSVRKV